jgi:polysaccharide biosynthesis protein PslH
VRASGTVQRVRTLVVAELYPWPPADGYRQRLHHIIGGLALAGPVDVLALDRTSVGPPGSGGPDVDPPWPGVRRARTAPTAERGAREWAAEWVGGDAPRRILTLDWGPARDVVGRELRGPWDLVWWSHVDSWWHTHDLVDTAARIVDFDNLEHLALRLRRRTGPQPPPGTGRAGRVKVAGRWCASRAFDVVDERRWDAAQHRCAAEVDHVVVCSELDVRRSGCDNAVVVPNGGVPADPPAVADRRAVRTGRPTMLFVGALDYEPNTLAVEWFVRHVLPVVRAHRPDSVVRVVGRGAERLAWAAGVPGVELTGPVDDLGAELRAADVSIVPIRVGAGTRLKVVEALANRLPLVTTTVGCEGIDVVDGVSALVADDARLFADACLRLLGDGDLRTSLAAAGWDLFAARYDWSGIRHRVADLARETVAAAGVSRG